MGSTSWQDNILQALLIGLVVQIVAYVLGVFCAFLWASLKKRLARPATDESMAESDLELGTVNAGEGATILGSDDLNGLAANSGVRDDGKLEHTEYRADMRASTPEARIPTQVEVLAGKEHRGLIFSSRCQNSRVTQAPVKQDRVDGVVADSAPAELHVHLDGTASLT